MTTTSDRVAAPARPAVPVPAPGSGARRWWALVFIALAQLMVVLDMTIVNIALPHIQQELQLTDANRQWVITAYTLAFGGLLLLGGRIADLVGRKTTFLVGLIGFGAASALGGAATTAGLLFGARALQGVFAAVLAPSALSLMTTTFTDPKDRSKAFGVFGAVAGGGSAIGLIAGGILTEKLDWRWCMYVNVPIAVIALIGGAVLLRGHREDHSSRRLDVPGVLFGCGGLLAIVYGMAEAETHGWSSHLVLAFLVGGGALLLLFGVVEANSKRPLLPPHVVADRNRAGAFLAVLLTIIGMFGLFLFLTYFLQVNLGYSPIRAGIAFLPMTVSIIIASSQVSARLLPYVPPRLLITPGGLLAAGGMVVLSHLTVGSGYLQVVLPAEIMLGFGMGLVMMPSMSTATQGVPPRDAGVTSATVNTSQQVGGSIGTALLNTVAATAATAYIGTHPRTALEAARGTVHGYTVAMWWAVGALVLAALLSGVLINARRPRLRTAVTSSHDSRDAAPEPGYGVHGTITGAGGRGLSGAVLTLIDPSGRQIGQTSTAAEGTYRLSAPASGPYVLIAAAAGYEPKAASITVQSAELEFDLALTGGARLSGIIRGADDALPVPGALVTLIEPDGSVIGSTTTDSEGRYCFDAVSAGQYTLSVSHPEHQPVAVATTVPSDGPAAHDIQLVAAAELSGTIRGPGNGPVDGARVSLLDSHGGVVDTTITDDSGRYRFVGVRPGDYTLVAAGYASAAQPLVWTAERLRHDIGLPHPDPPQG
jgi:EmrB/QacA subfamily drug resistance transporter